MSDDLTNAGITPKERLASIEKILSRIDNKLDSKADLALVISIETRMRVLELSKAEVDAERRIGSIETDALKQRVESRLNSLETDMGGLAKRMAYAGGGLSTVVVVANVLAAKFIAS